MATEYDVLQKVDFQDILKGFTTNKLRKGNVSSFVGTGIIKLYIFEFVFHNIVHYCLIIFNNFCLSVYVNLFSDSNNR